MFRFLALNSGSDGYRLLTTGHQSLHTAHCTLHTVLILLAAVFIFPLTGCRRGAEPGRLVIAIEATPRGFDPRLSTTSTFSARIMQLVYDTLIVRNERFEFVPSLAQAFEQSPDLKSFTFHLRPGVKFHNGQPLTARDVKYTFETLMSPALRSPIRSAVDKITSIETPDPQTVIFRAREPFYTFIGNLPAIGIIPDGAGVEIRDLPIGSGPYRLVSYREGETVDLESNQDYWDGAPSVPRIHIKVVADNTTRQAELMSGDVDLAYNSGFDPETVYALSRRSDIQVVIKEGANVDYIGMNLTPGSVLSSPKVRQAIAYACDSEVIIHRLLRDQARRAHAILPPEHWAYNPNVTTYAHDSARARQLLDEAGLADPDGDGPQPRARLEITTATTQISRNIASIIQNQLREVGIQIELQSLELATMLDRIGKAQFDMYYLRAIGFNQLTDVFQFVYHSRYQNPQFIEAISMLRAATDRAQMRPLFETIQSILARHDYCQNPEVDRLAAEAASVEDASARKQIYLEIARLLTDRGGQNRMRYCNPQVDRWIEEAERATERASQVDLLWKVQKVVSEELPQIYLWYPANVLVARKRVGNIQLDPSGSWYFIAKLTLE
jgi:peptide/nickel transport system substrate-binding protein